MTWFRSAALVAATMLSAPAALAAACDNPRQMDGFKTCANVEKAFEEGALTIYSPDPETNQAQMASAFKAAFPKITVTFLRLQTGALYANEIWIGNVIPLAPDQRKEAITCAVPCNAHGLSLWSRRPAALSAGSEFDAPLAWRYDESDSMVLCDDVKVPWEKVFVHDDALLSRDIYIRTPSHCFGNHQSNVRYWAKMRLLLGLCSKVAHASGADQVPAVRETLGRMAAVESTIGGLVHGQINAYERWPEPYVCFNRRFMYAGLEWCTQNYSSFVDQLRELCGGGVFQMPADISIMDDPALARSFTTFWQTPQSDAVTRMKLFKLAWDMVGSEFAGRHQQYEKFYAGASFIIRNHSYRETDWGEFNRLVDDLMAGYDYRDRRSSH